MAAMQKDLRWLLMFAWPLTGVSIWVLVKRLKSPYWRYGLFVLLVLSTGLGLQILNRSLRPPVNAENAEGYVKIWLAEFGLEANDVPVPKEVAFFTVKTRLKGGDEIFISRSRGNDYSLEINAIFGPPPKVLEQINALDKQTLSSLIHTLRIDVERQNMVGLRISAPLKKIGIVKQIPFSLLTKESLVDGVDSVAATETILQEEIQKTLDQKALGN